MEAIKLYQGKTSMKSMKLVKWTVDINRLTPESKMLDFFSVYSCNRWFIRQTACNMKKKLVHKSCSAKIINGKTNALLI